MNERGQIEAKSGLNGLRGGDITLCLPEAAHIIVPASDTPVPRFITVGGKGQDAENGGYLDYVPKENQRRITGDKQSVTLVDSKAVEYVLKNSDRLSWPSEWKDLLDKSYSVMHVKVVAKDDVIGKLDALSYEKGERVWPSGVPDAFPSGKAGDGGDGGMFRCFWAKNGVAVAGSQTPVSTERYVRKGWR